MSKIAKYLLNFILFLLCCIPVVTIAASITAMHFVNFKLAGGEDISVPREFFKSFKMNFVQSLFFLVLFGGLGYLLATRWIGVIKEGGNNTLFIGLLAIATFIFFILEINGTYLLAKFENTIKRLLMLTIYTSFKRVDNSVKMAGLAIAAIVVPLGIYYIDPNPISLTVGIVTGTALFVLLEVLSAKWMITVFNALVSQQEKKQSEDNSEQQD